MKNRVLNLKRILALGVIAIGVYMFANHQLPTPPAISGIGFLLTGLALWIPVCPCLGSCKN